MELKIDIEVNQLIGLIRQMTVENKLKIKKELDKDVKKRTHNKKNNGLTELLLAGPVMSDEEKENFKNIQKYFEIWTKNVFV